MITLDQIVSSNLGMLKEQEASLQQSLDFVQKAISLFQSQSGSGIPLTKRRGRRPGTTITKRKKGAVKTRNRKGGKHIDRIMAILKAKGSIGSGDLIDALFKSQTKDKNKQHFGTLIYPVLTKAYKSKTLQLKDGKIRLTS